MSFSGDYNAPEEQGLSPEYPSAFGLTFTPTVSGVLLGLLGIGGSIFLGISFVKPAFEAYQVNQNTLQESQDKVDTKKQGQSAAKLKELEDKLQTAQKVRPEVLKVFGTEKELNTLLLDINRLFLGGTAQLKSFKPFGLPTVVNDQFRQTVYKLEMEGTFAQTQTILRNLERLKSFVVVKNITTAILTESGVVFSQGQLISDGQPKLKTTFDLLVLVPIPEDELKTILDAKKQAELQKQAQQQGGTTTPSATPSPSP